MSSSASSRPLRVAVLGSGASGMAAVWSLSRFPDRFAVQVFDPNPSAGGVADSQRIAVTKNPKTGELSIRPLPYDDTADTSVSSSDSVLSLNDGVQGGSWSYRNVLQLHSKVNETPFPVTMNISFNQGPTHWTNYDSPSCHGSAIQRLNSEISRFSTFLSIVSFFEPIFFFLPISLVGRLFHSSEFLNNMLFPLTALFFGTGNQTPNVSTAILARVFTDPKMRIFELDREGKDGQRSLLSPTAKMFGFRSLRHIYTQLKKKSEEISGNQTVFHLKRGVKKVQKMENGMWKVVCGRLKDDSRPAFSSGQNWSAPPSNSVISGSLAGDQEFEFDVVIFSCDGESTQAILKAGSSLSFTQSSILSRIEYYSDVTFTHCDSDYMKQYYQVNPDKDQYFIHRNAENGNVEMSFNLVNYQPELNLFRDSMLRSGDVQDQKNAAQFNVYQTIYLDAERRSQWNIEQLNPKKILFMKWWRQFSHTWKHFLFVVPNVQFLQSLRRVGGRANGLLFCGSYTLLNTHETAVISGLAAAHRLGADYPFQDDADAKQLFELYYRVAHGEELNHRQSLTTRALRWSVMPILVLVWAIGLFTSILKPFRSSKPTKKYE